jgi:hypothetical protein
MADEVIAESFVDSYNSVIGLLPESIQGFINFFLLVLVVVIYAVLVWKFYRTISKKNVIDLNLNQYNKFNHPLLVKSIAAVLYFFEYLIIMPLLIFVAFGIFTFLLIVLNDTQAQDTSQILIISAIVIAAIRMTSYYKEALSQDIAKMLPFTLLAVSILDPNSFIEAEFVQRIFVHLGQIPILFGKIQTYLFFIIVLEALLRLFDFLFELFGINDIPDKKLKEEEEK